MSGDEPRGDEPSQDPAGRPGTDSQLAALFRTLTAEPAPGELAGEQAALAMFRAEFRTADRPERTIDSARQARRSARQLRLGLAVGAAAAVFGMIGAAYAAALPPPVQHLAYRLLGFAGVPDSRQSAQSGLPPGGSHSLRPTQGTTPATSQPSTPSSSRPPHPSRTPSPSGSPSPSRSQGPHPSPSAKAPPPARLSLTAAHAEITAGTTAVLTGLVTSAGRPLAGATVRLQERPAGAASWQVVATVTTGKDGTAVASVSDLTTNARFRLTDSRGGSSATVPVTVVPEVTLQVIAGPGGRKDALVVSAPAAQQGDLVTLQVQLGASWVTLREHGLNAHGKTAFVVKARRVAGRTLRAELPATTEHAASVSAPVTVPAG